MGVCRVPILIIHLVAVTGSIDDIEAQPHTVLRDNYKGQIREWRCQRLWRKWKRLHHERLSGSPWSDGRVRQPRVCPSSR